MEAEMDVKATVESDGGTSWWRVAWVVMASVVFLQAAQQYFGLGFTAAVPVDTARIVKDGEVYEWRLPHRYRNPLMTHRLILTENDRPMQRTEKVSGVLDRKNGWCNVYRDLLRFVPLDGSDPRSNGRNYVAHLPRQFMGWTAMIPLLVLAGLTAVMIRQRGPVDAMQGPRSLLGWVLGLSLAVGVLRVFGGGLYSDGTFVVGGLPESDASGWFQHGQGLAEGWGITTAFAGQRPFYGVLLSPLFLLPGDPLVWIKLLHILLWASAGAGVYALGASLSSRAVGLGCAFALMAGETHLPHVQAVLTENPGLGLAVLAALAFWGAIRKDSLWLLAVCGLLMGFGNLAAGATLLAVPPAAAVLLLFGWSRGGLKPAFLWAGVFTIAVSTVFLPWMIRQKLVFDTFTPSLNSGALLRGGADPVHKRMWAGMNDEPQKIGGLAPDDYGGEYRFHTKLFNQMVAENPIRYVKQVAGAWVDSFEFLRIADPGLRAAGVLFLLGLGLWGVWSRGDAVGLALALPMAGGWTLLDKSVVIWLLLAALAIMLWATRREKRFWLVLFLITNLAAGTGLSGLAGNQTTSRMWQVLDWTAFLVLFAAMEWVWSGGTGLLRRALRLRATGTSAATSGDFGVSMAVVASLVCLVATAFAVGRTAVGSGQGQIVKLGDTTKSDALARVRAGHPDSAVRQLADLNVALVRLTHLRYLQPAGYDTAHWMSHYGRRDFDRWVLMPDRADVHAAPDKRRSGAAEAVGDISQIPAGQVVLWVYTSVPQTFGLTGANYTSQLGLAAVPCNEGTPDWSKVVWLNRSGIR